MPPHNQIHIRIRNRSTYTRHIRITAHHNVGRLIVACVSTFKRIDLIVHRQAIAAFVVRGGYVPSL